MKKVEVTCDRCGSDISATDFMPWKRLVLTCEDLPFTGSVRAAVFVHRPIDRPHHFCGYRCLQVWLAEKFPEPKGSSGPGSP